MNKFICAAIPSIRRHCNVVFKHYDEYADREGLNKFLLDNCNKFLSSVGISLDIKRYGGVDNNLFKRYNTIFRNIKNEEYMKNIELVLDSAGYQFQCGLFSKSQIPKFIKMYHNFLIKNYTEYNNAFLFDPLLGDIDGYDEMKKYNIYSYAKASQLPVYVRDKLMFIYHFRTPLINRLYKELLFDYKLGDHFNNFATGGLVAFNRTSRKGIPCILYTIPLIYILNHAKRVGLRKFRFHILGNAEFKDIIFHRLIEKHVKEIHNIDLDITYDSSTIFKSFMMGRYFIYSDDSDQSLYKLFIRSDTLHKRFKNHGTNEDCFYKLINEISNTYGFKAITKSDVPVYNEHNRISPLLAFYGILLILRLYEICDKWAMGSIDHLYRLYTRGHNIEFNNKLINTLTNLNNGVLSRTIRYRSNAFINSMNAIEELDIEYSDYIIKTYLSFDEDKNLARNREYIMR